jgi:hypothetical protein
MRLPLHRRIGRWVFPTGRVPFPCLDPEVFKARFNDRCDRLPVFIKHRIRPLVIHNCHMVLEADAGGAYRAVVKHLWMVLKQDVRAFRRDWHERLKYLGLRLRGWDRASIALKWESEYEAEFGSG